MAENTTKPQTDNAGAGETNAGGRTAGGNGKNSTTKPQTDNAGAESATAAPASVYQYKVDGDGKVVTGNLTRDSIIETVRGKLVADGKSDEEALEAALKRGFQMVKEG